MNYWDKERNEQWALKHSTLLHFFQVSLQSRAQERVVLSNAGCVLHQFVCYGTCGIYITKRSDTQLFNYWLQVDRSIG